MEKKALGAIIAASAIIIGFAVVGIYSDNIMTYLYAMKNNRDIPSSAEVSDEELINRTKDLREVTAFLTKYPNPMIYVDRLDHFSVDYQVTEAELNGRPYNGTASVQPYTALKVRLSDKGYPAGNVLWCINDSVMLKIEWKIVEFLEKRDCFGVKSPIEHWLV